MSIRRRPFILLHAGRRLFVAGHAIAGGPALLVTGQTPAHLVRRCAGGAGHAAHLAMTGRALESMCKVPLVGEIDEIRETL